MLFDTKWMTRDRRGASRDRKSVSFELVQVSPGGDSVPMPAAHIEHKPRGTIYPYGGRASVVLTPRTNKPARPDVVRNVGGVMNAILRRRLEMAVRVRDFLRAHKTDAVGEGLGLAKLEELIQRAELLGAQQRAGFAVTRASAEQRRKLRRTLESTLLLYLRAVGEIAAQQDVQLADQFRLPPGNTSNQALLEAARGMLGKATDHKDLLVSGGMSPALVDALADAVKQFEQTLEASREGRRAHAGASADLDAVAAEINAQIKVLDGLVRFRFGNDAELMGAWRSARNVLGPFKTKSEPEPGAAGSDKPKAA